MTLITKFILFFSCLHEFCQNKAVFHTDCIFPTNHFFCHKPHVLSPPSLTPSMVSWIRHCLLGSEAVLLGELFPSIFRDCSAIIVKGKQFMNMHDVRQRLNISRISLFLDCFTLEVDGNMPHTPLGTVYWMTQHHMPEGLTPQRHVAKTQTFNLFLSVLALLCRKLKLNYVIFSLKLFFLQKMNIWYIIYL